MASSFKEEFAMLSLYQRLYESKYGHKASINKYKEKWAMQSLIEDYGVDGVRDIIEFYFKTNKDGHPISWMIFNFDTLKSTLQGNRTDIIMREERRKKTQELATEYLNGISG
jgi:hypothetical protein